jgi:hypothetical protein
MACNETAIAYFNVWYPTICMEGRGKSTRKEYPVSGRNLTRGAVNRVAAYQLFPPSPVFLVCEEARPLVRATYGEASSQQFLPRRAGITFGLLCSHFECCRTERGVLENNNLSEPELDSW